MASARPYNAAALALLAALAVPAPALAQVQLGGVMGSKALLVIDGQSQMLAVGESARGVRLVSLTGDNARVEHQGRMLDLRVGGTPLVLGAAAGGGGREIVIPVGQGGHYVMNGSINGQSVRFMVDTGATLVAMGRSDAARLGIDLRKGERGVSGTANGLAQTVVVTLDSVRVGDVELYNVQAAVTAANMPFVLLGNSFLTRFDIRSNSESMRLVRRY